MDGSIERKRPVAEKCSPLVHNQQFIVPNYKWWEKPFMESDLRSMTGWPANSGLGPSVLLSKEETLSLAPTLDTEGLTGELCTMMGSLMMPGYLSVLHKQLYSMVQWC
ncbi:MAG: hypothetical protein IPN29_01815 [Saprospiraceae bacterium]|nr:hypothetical protein [Saprospiraceae bacterium]